MMAAFILRRLVDSVPVLLLASVVVFSMLHLVPGDPVELMLGSADAGMSEKGSAVAQQVRQDLGLDQPLPIQYVRWLAGAAHGDFGMSYVRRRPVLDIVGERVPSTLELAGAGLAMVARLTRSSMLEVLNRPFITTAHAKGLGQRIVVMRHALRNALIPIVTVLGLQIGHLVAGSVIVETVFARQGMGQLAVEAILSKDFPVVQAVILFTATAYVLANLLVDIAYGYLDPQIRAGT